MQCLASGMWSRNFSNCSSKNQFFKPRTQCRDTLCVHVIVSGYSSHSDDCSFFCIPGISCSMPALNEHIKIMRGSTFLYSDKVLIGCANGKVLEIVCQADGQWSADAKLFCSA